MVYYNIIFYNNILTAVRQYDEIVNDNQQFPCHIIKRRLIFHSRRKAIKHLTTILKIQVKLSYIFGNTSRSGMQLSSAEKRENFYSFISFQSSTNDIIVLKFRQNLKQCIPFHMYTPFIVLSDSEKIDIHPAALRRRRSRASRQPCAVERLPLPK